MRAAAADVSLDSALVTRGNELVCCTEARFLVATVDELADLEAARPAQIAAGIAPLRRVYDLRHTFATFALRAGISTFDLSRYMGASLTMIDRHYGHLARDGREHAIRLLDGYADITAADVQDLDVGWTPQLPIVAGRDNGNSA
jgi:hypothetical protein